MSYFNTKHTLKKDYPFFVVDVETYSLKATKSNLWFGCIYGENYKGYFKTVEQFKTLVKHQRFTKAYIYAHNGGKFDYLVLFGNLLAGESCYVGSRFISYIHGESMYGDSYNLLKASVEDIGNMLELPKLDLKDKGNTKKGTKPTKKDIDYCFRDCEIIYVALKRLFEGEKPRLTIGSLALAVYQRRFLPFKLKFDKEIEREYLNAYYGGRTEAFKIGKVNDEVFDINSMYPYAMIAANYPHPSFSYNVKKPSVEKLLRLLEITEGCAKITVNVPRLKYQPLPYLYENRLIFPYGQLTFWYCFPEIRNAIKQGCTIESCEIIITSSRTLKGKDLFGGFVEHFYNLKNNSKSEFERMLYKYILNNLYGKFGQHKFKTTKYFYTKQECIDYIRSQPDSEKWSYSPFNKIRDDCYAEKTTDKLTHHSVISVAAYITSFCRVLLYDYMMKYNPDYCDTDSLFIDVNIKTKPKESTELGLLKREKYTVVKIQGCKDYVKKKDGKETEIIKGVTKRSKRISEHVFENTFIASPKTALKRSVEIGSLVTMTKVLSRNYNKGIVKNKDIRTGVARIEPIYIAPV